MSSQRKDRSNSIPRLTFWTKVWLAAASALVGLLAAELLIRMAAPQLLVLPYRDYVNGVRSARPQQKGRLAAAGLFDVTITFNGQRFRGTSDVSLEPPRDVHRVAVLGDSFVFGWGVDDHESLPARLEDALNAGKEVDVRRYEVINAGIPGQYMGEKVLWYEDWVRAFRPATVVLGVLVDDADTDSGYSLFTRNSEGSLEPRPVTERIAMTKDADAAVEFMTRSSAYRFMSQRSHLFCLLRRVASIAFGRISPAARRSNNPSTNDRQAFETVGVPLLGEQISWLKARVEEDGARLIVVYLPIREEIHESRKTYADEYRWKASSDEYRWKASLIRKNLHDQADSGAIELLDATEPLRRLSLMRSTSFYNSGRDTHPTAEGYHEIALLVAERIRPGHD